MAYLGKEYTLQKDENFDAFLKVVGIPADETAKLAQFKPTNKLEKDGDTYTFTSTNAPGRTQVVKFKSGVEQDDEMRGLSVKSTYNVDGNTVTQVIKSDDKVTTFKREYDGDKLKVTITTNFWDGVATRYYTA